MHASSPALTATLRALRGETDLRVIAPAFSNRRFARVLALATGVNVVVSAPGALAGGLPDILTPAECASPALAAAIASLIGTDAGHHILGSWADVAPVGWGASHAADVIDAVRCNRCASWVAAALIGPCDASAALLHKTMGHRQRRPALGTDHARQPDGVDGASRFERAETSPAYTRRRTVLCRTLPPLATDKMRSNDSQSPGGEYAVSCVRRLYQSVTRYPHQSCRYPIGAHATVRTRRSR